MGRCWEAAVVYKYIYVSWVLTFCCRNTKVCIMGCLDMWKLDIMRECYVSIISPFPWAILSQASFLLTPLLSCGVTAREGITYSPFFPIKGRGRSALSCSLSWCSPSPHPLPASAVLLAPENGRGSSLYWYSLWQLQSKIQCSNYDSLYSAKICPWVVLIV